MRKRITIIVAILLISAVCLGVFVACEAKEWGKFYSLQEAYDQGLLSVEDLEQIAEYNNNPNAEGRPTVEALDRDIARKIKESFVHSCKNQMNPIKDAKVSGISIIDNLGTYDNAVVTQIKSIYHVYLPVVIDIEVGGVVLSNVGGAELLVWIKN